MGCCAFLYIVNSCLFIIKWWYSFLYYEIVLYLGIYRNFWKKSMKRAIIINNVWINKIICSKNVWRNDELATCHDKQRYKRGRECIVGNKHLMQKNKIKFTTGKAEHRRMRIKQLNCWSSIFNNNFSFVIPVVYNYMYQKWIDNLKGKIGLSLFDAKYKLALLASKVTKLKFVVRSA